MSSAEPKYKSYSLPSSISSSNAKIPDYLPEKTPLKSVRDLYPADFGKTIFDQILLPGKGKKPSTCQDWSSSFCCPNCGKPHFTKGDCGKSTCPDCEIDWRYSRTQSIMERILSLKIQRGKRCRHFVVSPEVVDYPESIEDLKKLRKQAYQFAKSKGVEGGVVFPHLFKILPSADYEDSFRGWKKLLEKDWGEILKCVYYAPHFHILGVGEKGNYTFEEAKESDKFIWKGISELSDSEDLGKCVMYLLSHLGIFKKSNYNSVVWFGSLSSSKWSLDRATMRLRNGSTVKEFTLDLVEDFVGQRHEEENGSLVCDNCGAGLVHISSAPDLWEKKDLEFEAELKVAYGWWRGSIPPPKSLENREDCWDYLEKMVLNELGVVEDISNLVRGKSCLKVVGEVEDCGS